MKPPLLVQVELLGGTGKGVRDALLPLLARLAQAERPLVLLAERPDRWAPTRSRVDRAFGRQSEIEAEIRRAGGVLDAIVYIDMGLFSRKHQHERILADLANRYDAKLEEIEMITRPGRMADALSPYVGSTELVEDDRQFERTLAAKLD